MNIKYEHGGAFNRKVKIDFSVNTNPLGPAPQVIKKIRETAECAGKYPEYESLKLAGAIADREGAHGETIVVGNGASELISALFWAYAPQKVLLVSPGFYGYERAAISSGCEIKRYYTLEDNGFEVGDDFTDYIDGDVDMIFITNPGNPSGRLVRKELIEKICKKADEYGCVVVLDECFFDFTDEAAGAVRALRLKAFTKYQALAGIRLGYLICPDKEAADLIKAVLPEWNVSAIAQAAGEKALECEAYYEKSKTLIRDEKEYLKREMQNLGIRCFESDVNFMLFRSVIEDLKERLLEYGIMIRDCSNFEGLNKGYYRISIKKHDENRCLIESLKEIYGKNKK